MSAKLNHEQRRVRDILIEVAKGRKQTCKPGVVSYKELWEMISDKPWGRAYKDPIVRMIHSISLHEIERNRPPLNELVVVKAIDEPGDEWGNIKDHLERDAGIDIPYDSHQSAQESCWAYWGRKDNTRISDDEAEEGYLEDTVVKFRRRNAKLIYQCKERDKYICQACGFVLNENGIFVIDVHHKNPLSSSDKMRITRLADLICLCPTCHRVAHTRKYPLKIDEIRSVRKI